MTGDIRLLVIGSDLRLDVEGVGRPGVGDVGVPEGEASLPCLLRLHPLQPRPGHRKCL